MGSQDETEYSLTYPAEVELLGLSLSDYPQVKA